MLRARGGAGIAAFARGRTRCRRHCLLAGRRWLFRARFRADAAVAVWLDLRVPDELPVVDGPTRSQPLRRRGVRHRISRILPMSTQHLVVTGGARGLGSSLLWITRGLFAGRRRTPTRGEPQTHDAELPRWPAWRGKRVCGADRAHGLISLGPARSVARSDALRSGRRRCFLPGCTPRAPAASASTCACAS